MLMTVIEWNHYQSKSTNLVILVKVKLLSLKADSVKYTFGLISKEAKYDKLVEVVIQLLKD